MADLNELTCRNKLLLEFLFNICPIVVDGIMNVFLSVIQDKYASKTNSHKCSLNLKAFYILLVKTYVFLSVGTIN